MGETHGFSRRGFIHTAAGATALAFGAGLSLRALAHDDGDNHNRTLPAPKPILGGLNLGLVAGLVAPYDFIHVFPSGPKNITLPFTGGMPAVQATVGNHVEAVVLTLPTVTPQITQGTLSGLGLASATRNTAVPNVPTYGEMGYPNVYSGSWVAFFAPAKTPDAIVGKLNATMNEVMADPEVLQKLKVIGFDPIVKGPAATVDYFKSEVANWGKMVRAVGITVD